MTSNTQHHKHAKIARAALGKFARNEWAILGTSCGKIQEFASQLITYFSNQYNCAYVDSSHNAHDEELHLTGMLAAGAVLEYTDALQSTQIQLQSNRGEQKMRSIFNDCDIVFVNGNHHQASRQIVMIDSAKEPSLKKRMSQLTDVSLVVLMDGNTEVFDFLTDNVLKDRRVPVLPIQDFEGIIGVINREILQNLPKLNGLVLAGGRSIRMGQDKGQIAWHGKPQREHLADLLQHCCEQVFISCRPDQSLPEADKYPILPDSFLGIGPMGALLTAFQAFPDHAWMTVACDLPLLDEETIQQLLESRKLNKTATAFMSPTENLPEPLITIWEPKSYLTLLSFLAQGYSCPRKVLMNTDIAEVIPNNPNTLLNVNTPEEMLHLLQAFPKIKS